MIILNPKEINGKLNNNNPAIKITYMINGNDRYKAKILKSGTYNSRNVPINGIENNSGFREGRNARIAINTIVRMVFFQSGLKNSFQFILNSLSQNIFSRIFQNSHLF